MAGLGGVGVVLELRGNGVGEEGVSKGSEGERED